MQIRYIETMHEKRKASPLGPPKAGKEMASFRLDTELYGRIRRAAKRHGHPMVTVVEWCFRRALPELEEAVRDLRRGGQ